MSSSANPTIGGVKTNTPLENLFQSALRQFGETSVGSINGDVALLMIEFANEIIEDIRTHPYQKFNNRDGTTTTIVTDLRYYTDKSERREIPDGIMIAGLLARYSIQQSSEKSKMFWSKYTKTMNQLLFNRWSELQGSGGNDFPAPRVTDGGSNPRYNNQEPVAWS